MILYLNGQDIARIVFGIIGEEEISIAPSSPDAYLDQLRHFLGSRRLNLDQLERIVCIVGPGSATGLRVTLAFVQAIAFAKEIPLVGIEKQPEADEQVFFSSLTREWILTQSPQAVLTPKYLHAPQITAPKRDALKRSL